MGRRTVMERLGQLMGQWGDEEAIEFAVGTDRTWWSWAQVGAVRSSLDGLLAARALDDRATIGIVMRQLPALVAAELAVLALGRTALLVSPLQAERELVAELGGLDVAVLLAHRTEWERPGVRESVTEAGTLGITIDDDGSLGIAVEIEVPRPGSHLDAAVTVSTSGTTGPPKRLPVAWPTFVELGGGPEGRVPRSGRGALILSLPLVTLGGLLSMARLVFGGRPMAMMERFDVQLWSELVAEHRPTVIGAPPPVVKMILDADIPAERFAGATAYLTSSAAVAPEVAREFERRYGIPVLLGYGATEFLNSVTGWSAQLWDEFGATKLGSVGRARPGVRLRVVGPGGSEVPTGEEGLLEVDPPQRAGHLDQGWLRTADLAHVDPDGFVWIHGRADDVIVRGGFKVDLKQIESALTEHRAVDEACAVGLADERLGQVPAALVSAGSGTELTADELIEWVRDRVPPYAVPTLVRIVEGIPRTSTLKHHRAEVRRMLSEPE